MLVATGGPGAWQKKLWESGHHEPAQTLLTKETNSLLGYTGKEFVSRLMEVTFPFSPALVNPHVEFCVWCWAGSPVEEKHGLTEKSPLKGHGDD